MASTRSSLIGRFVRIRRHVCLLTMAAMVPLVAGCYGNFPLTKAVYRANGKVENRYARQGVFWLFVIIPVYGCAAFVDAIGLNLIAFWTGEDVEVGSTIDADGNKIVVAQSEDGDELTMTVSRDGEMIGSMRFVRVAPNHYEAFDGQGRLAAGIYNTADGGLRFTDADGNTVSTVSGEEVALLRTR